MIPDNYECDGQLVFEWDVTDINVGNKYTEENFEAYMNSPMEEE